MVDVVTKLAREGVLCELLYGDDIVMISETIDGCMNKFIKWKEASEHKGLKINLNNTKVMVNGGITKDSLSKCKDDPCEVSSLRVKTNSLLCGK